MRTLLKLTILFPILAALAGCIPNEEASKSSPSTATSTKEAVTEIVFRGRFYMDKFCTEGPKGELGLGDHQVCEVLEVLRGELKLKRLIDLERPKGVREGETYTFRWRPSESTLKAVRKAEAGGYTGMHLGAKLELTPDREK